MFLSSIFHKASVQCKESETHNARVNSVNAERDKLTKRCKHKKCQMLGKSHPLMGSTGKEDISKKETWIKFIQSEMQTGKNDVCVRV